MVLQWFCFTFQYCLQDGGDGYRMRARLLCPSGNAAANWLCLPPRTYLRLKRCELRPSVLRYKQRALVVFGIRRTATRLSKDERTNDVMSRVKCPSANVQVYTTSSVYNVTSLLLHSRAMRCDSVAAKSGRETALDTYTATSGCLYTDTLQDKNRESRQLNGIQSACAHRPCRAGSSAIRGAHRRCYREAEQS